MFRIILHFDIMKKNMVISIYYLLLINKLQYIIIYEDFVVILFCILLLSTGDNCRRNIIT
jgi:hypothetical protein